MADVLKLPFTHTFEGSVELQRERLLEKFASDFRFAMNTLNAIWVERLGIDELLPSLAPVIESGLAGEILDFMESFPLPEKNTVNGLAGTIPFRRPEMGTVNQEANNALFYRLKLAVLEFIADPALKP